MLDVLMGVNVVAVVETLLLLYWIAVIVLIISEDRDPTAALAWLLVLLALPVLGLVLYFFLGRNWSSITQRSRTTRRVNQTVEAFMPAIYAPYRQQGKSFAAGLDRSWAGRNVHLIEQKVDAPVLPVRTCAIYPAGAEYFDVLLADLAGAQRFIHLSYFIWKEDALTARIAAVLADRLAAGVEVRILNDFLGCFGKSKKELRRLRDLGALVGSDMTEISRLNYRNHRKIAVIDAEIGHTGGFNVGQEYIDGGKRFPAWRDTGLRMTGPGVTDLEKLFDVRWLAAQREDLFQPRYYPDPELPPGEIFVQTVHQGYDDPWNSVTRSYQLAISGARERIILQSPYVVPDPSTLDALVNAAAGGVRVDLMTTLWLDKRVPWWAAESFFERLLAAGVRVWQWEPGFFHAKSLTIDDEACALGTLNLDIRSLRLSKELMVWIYDRETVARHRQILDDDLADCRELTLADVRGWGRPRRFRNSIARLLSNLL